MGKNVRKYWIAFKAGWELSLEYRLDFLFNILRTSVIPFLMVFFWLAIYKDKKEIAGFNFSSMITYYLGVIFLYSNNTGWISNVVSRDIKYGIITNNLLKPVSYFKLIFFHFFSSELFMSLLRFFICTAILFFLPFKPFKIFYPTVLNLFLFLIMLFLGYILNFILNILVSLTAFIMVENFMLRLSFLFLMRFFNGYMVPLVFFPPILQKIISLTPFAYQFYFPIMILLGKLSLTNILFKSVILLFLLFFLVFLTKTLWERALKHYEAVGR